MSRLLLLTVLLAAPASQANEEADAKNYFSAGAQAYAVGKFPAAISAFELAYKLSPLPGILFSLAQAERRQYFVDRDPAHLSRAIDAFHRYVDGEVQGGRRVEAVEALSELEPLLVRIKTAKSPTSEVATVSRLMISCPTAGATVTVDDRPPAEAPYIEDIAAGPHRVKVSAPGYFDEERTVPVSLGALMALDLPLRERPAELTLKTEDGTAVWVDGQEKAVTPLDAPLSLPPGAHRLGLLRQGRAPFSELLVVERGDVFTREAKLHVAPQRVWAWSLLITGAAAIVTGVVFSGLAVDAQNRALAISNRESGGLTPADLFNYNTARADQTVYIAASVTTIALGAVLDLISLPLFFSRPTLTEPTTTFRTHPEAPAAAPAAPTTP